jgi:hypothetical protein
MTYSHIYSNDLIRIKKNSTFAIKKIFDTNKKY